MGRGTRQMLRAGTAEETDEVIGEVVADAPATAEPSKPYACPQCGTTKRADGTYETADEHAEWHTLTDPGPGAAEDFGGSPA